MLTFSHFRDRTRSLPRSFSRACARTNAPMQEHPPSLVMRLGAPIIVQGLHLWNYNRSWDDSFRGVRDVNVLLDGKFHMSFIARKASRPKWASYVGTTRPGYPCWTQ